MQVKSEEFNGLSPYVRYAAAPVRGTWSSGRRILRNYLLFRVESGWGRIILDGQEIPLCAGGWYWVPPGKEVILEGFAPPDMLVPYVHFDLIYNPRYANLPVTEPGLWIANTLPFNPIFSPSRRFASKARFLRKFFRRLKNSCMS
jgi:hypothetical protein